MAKQILDEKVIDVARMIVDLNEPYYSKELIDLLPGELLDVELSDNNLHQTSIRIDQLRFWAQCELMGLLGMFESYDSKVPDNSWEELSDVLNNEELFDELSSDQQKKVKEVKFLSNVALTVLHQ